MIVVKKNRVALITGITGQCGSYLAELLIRNGYIVHGLVRRSSFGYGNLRNLQTLLDDPEIYRKRLFLHAGDLADGPSIYRVIQESGCDEIYNLGAQADVQESFLMPEMTIDINGTAVIRILEAVRMINPEIKVYQASTSELFGETEEQPQNELTRFNPQSPYSIGKLVGYYAIQKYRQAYGLWCCTGILFNHESPRRGDDFVTRKITKAAARIKLGKQKELRLGNLEAHRDWGYAPEYMEFVIKMMQQDKPDDYAIGTGETHTVREWLEATFDYLDLKVEDHLVIDQRLFRPLEVDTLQADYTKANEKLGFYPNVRFKDLIKIMVNADMERESK